MIPGLLYVQPPTVTGQQRKRVCNGCAHWPWSQLPGSDLKLCPVLALLLQPWDSGSSHVKCVG